MITASREDMEVLQEQMQASNERALIPSAHHFAEIPKGSIYARETYLPQDTVVMGKIHKYETINFITMGHVLVVNPEQPEQNKVLVAPYTFVSPAGSKRLVKALTDSIWITVHPAESQDLGKIEGELIAIDYSELSLDEKKALGDLQA